MAHAPNALNLMSFKYHNTLWVFCCKYSFTAESTDCINKSSVASKSLPQPHVLKGLVSNCCHIWRFRMILMVKETVHSLRTWAGTWIVIYCCHKYLPWYTQLLCWQFKMMPWHAKSSLHKGPVMRSFGVLFYVSLNKLQKKPLSSWQFETPWRSCSFIVIFSPITHNAHTVSRKGDLYGLLWVKITLGFIFIDVSYM